MTKKEKELNSVLEEIEILKKTQSVHTRRVNELNNIKRQLLKDIEDEKPKDITITDHAVLRYIERVYKLDLEKIKEEIINSELNDFSSILGGNGKYIYKDITFVVQNYKIVTIYNN